MKRQQRWWLVGLAAALLAGGCAPLEQPVRSDFLAVCKATAQEHGGKITKEEFLAQAQNKEKAGQIFEACDTEHHGYLTEQELNAPQKQRMMQEVIRLTSPPR